MFTIYSKDKCSYCVAAKELLASKNKPFIDLNIEHNENNRKMLFEVVPDARTVPQIFFNKQYIGGYAELVEWFNFAGNSDFLVEG